MIRSTYVHFWRGVPFSFAIVAKGLRARPDDKRILPREGDFLLRLLLLTRIWKVRMWSKVVSEADDEGRTSAGISPRLRFSIKTRNHRKRARDGRQGRARGRRFILAHVSLKTPLFRRSHAFRPAAAGFLRSASFILHGDDLAGLTGSRRWQDVRHVKCCRFVGKAPREICQHMSMRTRRSGNSGITY